MAPTSVKAAQLGLDPHRLPQGPGEHAARRRTLEARQAAARVGAPARFRSASDESAVAGGEAKELALRRPPAAADARSFRG
jgi:hypothetical protein